MKEKACISFILVGLIMQCFSQVLFAQTDSLKMPPEKKKYALTLDITTPFAWKNPRYKLGVYFPRRNNIETSLQVGFGHEAINPYIPFLNLMPSHNELENYVFVEVCPEIRFLQ